MYCRRQDLITERKKHFVRPISGTVYPLTKKIRCGCCGSVFRRKITNGIVYWICDRHDHKGVVSCSNPQIPEEVIYGVFLRLYHMSVLVLMSVTYSMYRIRE